LLLDGPQYTRPAEFRGWKAPEVLLSGHHEAVRRWRRQAALEKTRRLRPDLLKPRNHQDESSVVEEVC
jgi:tRNA (guanine37-N1)-methyltransferase